MMHDELGKSGVRGRSRGRVALICEATVRACCTLHKCHHFMKKHGMALLHDSSTLTEIVLVS